MPAKRTRLMPDAQINALHAAATGGLFLAPSGAYFASWGAVTAAAYKLREAGFIRATGQQSWQNDRRGRLVQGQHIEATEAGRAKLAELGIPAATSEAEVSQ